MKIYALKTCDTCRKAIKALRESGHDPEVIDVRSDGIPADDLRGWIGTHGLDTLVNKRSTTWKGLDDHKKTDLDIDTAVALISEYPTLMKRPVILHGNDVTIGWTKDVAEFWLD